MKIKKLIKAMMGANPSNQQTRLFSAKGDDDTLTLDLYGTVGDWWEYNEAQDLLNILNQNKTVKHIIVNVHSLGGFFLEGVAIMNQLREHPAKVTMIVQGVAASMASLILMAADVIKVHEASWIMIHEAEVTAQGRASELENHAEWLKEVNEQAAQAYSARTGIAVEEIHKMMTAETWMTGTKAVELGFADELISLNQAQQTAGAQMKSMAKQPISFAALDVYSNVPLECLPTNQTATLLGRISETKLENNKVAESTGKPTAVQIAAAQAVVDHAANRPSPAELAEANKVLAAADPAEIAAAKSDNPDQPNLNGNDIEKPESATEIAQLCQLAGKPERTAEFLTAQKTAEEVRAILATERTAELNGAPPVSSQIPQQVPEDQKTMSQMAAESCEKQGLTTAK